MEAAPSDKAAKEKIAEEPSTKAEKQAAVAPAKEAGKEGPGLARALLLTVVAAIISFVGVRVLVAPQTPEPTASSTPSASPPSPAASSVRPAASARESAPAPEDLPLPAGVLVAQEKGLLEIESGDKQAIYVDGAFVGRGPVRRVPLDPGTHQVELREGARQRQISVSIVRARRTRLALGAGRQAESANPL